MLFISPSLAFAMETTESDQDGSENNGVYEEIQEIEEVQVVGRMTRVDVTAEDIERYQVTDLEDIFRHIPSVSVGGSLGLAQKIYIRGMEDTLLNVKIDGAPQTGTLFHHIGRVKIEPELLRLVTVQTGAGEATAGFGAIGGSIRFYTKDADDMLEPGQNFGTLVKAGVWTNDGWKASVSPYMRLSENWSLLASYVYVDRDDLEDGDGNTLLGTSAEQSLAFIKLSGDIGETQYLSLSYEYRDEQGQFGQRPNWPVLEGDILYPGDGNRHTTVLNYRMAASNLLNIEGTAYLTKSDFVQDRFDAWGRYGAEIDTYGFDLRNTSMFGKNTLTYGLERRNDKVVSQYLSDPSEWQYWAWDPDIGKFSEKGTATGFYIQDHLQATEALLLSFGLRYDNYDFKQLTYGENTDSDGWSGNAGLQYSMTDEWTFLTSYAQAMRGKEIGDAFTLEKRPGRLRLQPNLLPEKVGNFEIGVEYLAGPYFASVVYFDTEIKDVIFDQLGTGPFPQDAGYFENIGNYHADGFELELGYQGDRLLVGFAYSHTSADINGIPVEGYEHNGLGNGRGDNLNLSLDYEASDRWTLGWTFLYVDGLDDIDVLYRSVELGWIDDIQTINKPGYSVQDIYVTWQPTQNPNFVLSLAVQNLFDKQYRDHSSVGDYSAIPGWEIVSGLYEPGRDIRLSFAAKF